MIPVYARWGFTFFFVTHIFITLLLDVQALSFGDNFPEVLKSLMRVCTAMHCLSDTTLISNSLSPKNVDAVVEGLLSYRFNEETHVKVNACYISYTILLIPY